MWTLANLQVQWIDLCGGGDAGNLYDYRSNLLAGTDADSPALDK